MSPSAPLPFSDVVVRPFARADREQLTALVNAHAAAVVPNLTVSVQTLLSSLEREPGEVVVDPWVAERATLVAEQRGRVVAGAHLLRYADRLDVAAGYRGAGEVRWLLFWPPAGYWPDAARAARPLLQAGLAQLARWRVARVYADGTLPVPGAFGVPEQWPHVRSLLTGAGFVPSRREVVHVAGVADLARPAPPLADLHVRREVGSSGTRFSAVVGAEVLGYVEVDSTLDAGSRASRAGAWADVANLHVQEEWRRRGIASWLLGQAGDWLELGGVDRLLSYTRTPRTAPPRRLSSPPPASGS